MPMKSPPPQHQETQPGREHEMRPPPEYAPRHHGSGKLKGKVALISGGDSGIGRAVCLAMAREGAEIAFVYLEEDKDAADTLDLLRQEGREGLAIKGDVGSDAFCRTVVEETLKRFRRLDSLVNNARSEERRVGK